MTIRPYAQKDKEAVRNVCLYCDGPENFSEGTKNFLLSTYCDYYIEKEPYNCFVAADENDNAVGYIICTEDFDAFIKCFNEEYFTRIPSTDTQNRYYASMSYIPHKKHKDLYPAHLHIDIFTEYQRMGLGHRLMDALVSHLKEKRIRGLMLTVAKNNEKGFAFYKKYGFEIIEDLPDCTVYGIRLS